jgi:hypothetical protein
MILVTAFFAAVLVALARGGSLDRLARLNLRLTGFVLFALLLQFWVIYVPERQANGWTVRVLVLIASYLILAGFVWLNRRVPGMWLLGVGLLVNLAVMVANGGYMPVTREALEAAGHAQLILGDGPGARVMGSKDVVLPLAETHLGILSDIFVVPPPFPIPSVFSVGDVLIGLGIFRLVQRAMGTREAIRPMQGESV